MTDALIEEIVREWAWAGMHPEQVTAISAFGHLIVRDTAGAFWYLDPEMRTLERIASDEAGLSAYMSDPDAIELWEAERLVERAHAVIGAPPPGHCYSLSIAALLEGNYAVDDFWHPPVRELIGVMGSIERQLREQGVADGGTVRLTIKD